MNRCLSEQILYPISHIDKQIIKDYQYEEFLSLLSRKTIQHLSEECKQKHINTKRIRKDIKLTKRVFIIIMQSTFSFKTLYSIYELIFARFKIIKCQLKNPNQNNDTFFIHNLIDEDEINIYEVLCALCCFIKCDFQSRLHLLFDITDIDDDGLISKGEVKQLVYTINSIFSKEEGGIETHSTIISQSLASIKSKRYYQMLMNSPGDLANEMGNNNYTNYEQFYSAVQRLSRFSIKIIPCFVDFKAFLNTKRTEEEIKIKQKHYRDYAHVSNDLLSVIRNENEYDPIDKEAIRGSLICNSDAQAKALRNSIDNRKSRLCLFSKSKLLPINKSKMLIQTRSSIDLINSPNAKCRRSVFFNYNSNRENMYEIEYNKINSMQSYPGKITIVEPIKTEVAKDRDTFKRLSMKIRDNRKSSYLTLEKMNLEINVASDKKRIEEQSTQYLMDVKNSIVEVSTETKKLLKDPNPYQNLVIRKIVKNAKQAINRWQFSNALMQ